jgi:cytoskeletal protein CcmA (bactofilin family)
VLQPTREPKSRRRPDKVRTVKVATHRLTSKAATDREERLFRNQSVSASLPALQGSKSYQTKLPVITGEAHYRGMLPVDGILVGQLGGNGGSLAVRQKTGSVFAAQPELTGEINFRDLVRVNGHIAGTVYSKSGTLIVDTSATVDADVEVAVAVIDGTVRGDIVAHERIELRPGAKIYGNIWTRSIAVKDGAFFDGVCTMLELCRPAD